MRRVFSSPHIRRWVVIPIVCIGVLAAVSTSFAFAYEQRWQGRITPGVTIGALGVGGLTREEAQEQFNRAADALVRDGFAFVYQSASATVAPSITASDPDLAYELVQWDTDATLDRALAIGRSGAWWARWGTQLRTRVATAPVRAAVVVERAVLTDVLTQQFGNFETPTIDARVVVNENGVTIEPERAGRRFQYNDAITLLETSLAAMERAPITLTLVADYPETTAADLEPFRQAIADIIAQGDVTLTDERTTWNIPAVTLGTWLTVARDTEGRFALTLDDDAAGAFLQTIASAVHVPARDARFVLAGNRVSEFQTSRPGTRLNVPATLLVLRDHIIAKKTAALPLVMETVTPSVTDADVNTFGITELLGTGHSNFSGSPKNRRHNIAVGARSLHGILIAPEEEFSLLAALGDINAATGYLPELVIKGNRTIPEYGGGLCQIGTTMFRAAMASGLPVTERQSHSYAVSYYFENGKPGTDATIYGPKPDFRFRNDTGKHILIQTRIEDDDLFFEFWGTSDGRVAERSVPTVTNVRQPPPTLMVETDDLPPGEKKCTERAHTGMTAEFTYTVTLGDGTIRKQVFRSHYRPWQAVCLVGKTE